MLDVLTRDGMAQFSVVQFISSVTCTILELDAHLRVSNSTHIKVHFTPPGCLFRTIPLIYQSDIFDFKFQKVMSNKSFTTTLLVEQSPKEVFNAINNVRGWWSEQIQGSTDKLNAEFLYQYKDVHRCKMKLVEFEPEKKVVWRVVENYFSFTEDETEWKDTRISFEISREGTKTKLVFTHIGLVPEYECFEVCREGWTNYVNGSLLNLITFGKGEPNPKEGGFNAEIVKKWNLQE